MAGATREQWNERAAGHVAALLPTLGRSRASSRHRCRIYRSTCSFRRICVLKRARDPLSRSRAASSTSSHPRAAYTRRIVLANARLHRSFNSTLRPLGGVRACSRWLTRASATIVGNTSDSRLPKSHEAHAPLPRAARRSRSGPTHLPGPGGGVPCALGDPPAAALRAGEAVMADP